MFLGNEVTSASGRDVSQAEAGLFVFVLCVRCSNGVSIEPSVNSSVSSSCNPSTFAYTYLPSFSDFFTFLLLFISIRELVVLSHFAWIYLQKQETGKGIGRGGGGVIGY